MPSTSTDVVMGDNSEKQKIKLNPPKPFSGKREELQKFLHDCQLYMMVNKTSYNTNFSRIIFVLSFMDDGEAASWKEQLLEEKFAQTDPDFRNWVDFKDNLVKAFKPYNAPGDAREELKKLNFEGGKESIDEHIAKFRMLLIKAKLGKDEEAVCDIF